VDGSPEAHEAAELALELAGESGAEVVFVHVRSVFDPLVEDELADVPHHLATVEQDEVLSEAARLADEKSVRFRLELLSGRPEEEIVRLADAIDAGLIVIGSRGLGTVKSAVLGSVSKDVLAKSGRPVAIVKSTTG
jgi:nucleotide-binding universal stress UspA family protein